MGFRPIPRSRAYLGATSEWLGLDNHPCAYGNNRVASLSIALRKSLRYDSTRLWPFRSRQEGRMCLTIDELSPKVMLSKEDLHAAPARSDHPGVGSVCATVFTAGLAPCPTLASGGDAGSGSPYGHGRLTGHGAGDGAPFHELPSGLEPGHVVSSPGQSDSARVAHYIAGARRGDDRPWRGRVPWNAAVAARSRPKAASAMRCARPRSMSSAVSA
jgi:hypothetical protein